MVLVDLHGSGWGSLSISGSKVRVLDGPPIFSGASRTHEAPGLTSSAAEWREPSAPLTREARRDCRSRPRFLQAHLPMPPGAACHAEMPPGRLIVVLCLPGRPVRRAVA